MMMKVSTFELSELNFHAVAQQNRSKQAQGYVKLVNCYTKPLMTSFISLKYFFLIDNKLKK